MAKLYIGNTVLLDTTVFAPASTTYTKTEVDGLIENVDVSDQLSNYVEKVEGKGLSTNDYDATAKAAVDSLSTTYVAKDGDKVLSDNNFTNDLKTKLEGLANFDPTSINSAISAIQTTLADITGDGKDVTDALDTWNEIKAFVADYAKTDSIASLLSTLENNIHSWVEGKNYLTEHQSLAAYKTKAENDELYQAKGEYLTAVPADYKTKTENDALYQAKGNYLTEHQSLADYAKSADVATTYQTKSDSANHINGSGVTNIVKISNADYEALVTKDSGTLYIVG